MAKSKYKLDPVWAKRYGHEPTFDEIFKFFGYPAPRKEALGEPMYMPETTCFAFGEDGESLTGCMCLTKTYCCYGKCNFYKPVEQAEQNRKMLIKAREMMMQNKERRARG